MVLLLITHAVFGLAILIGGRRLGARSFLVAALAPVATVVWTVVHLGDVADGALVSERHGWVPGLGLDVELLLGPFAVLMVWLVSGVGALVFVYAWKYFDGSAAPHRIAGMLTLFSGSMLGLVLADNLLWLFVCWELTSITSYLLIGNDDHQPGARAAALQALLITGAGGLVMLAGFIVLGLERDTFRISTLVADPVGGSAMTVSAVLILVGAFTKSAQVPFHSWLPGAMVAATPTSAYLHSAAMVKAGIFLVLRLGPAFDEVATWRSLAVTVGVVTMLVGGLRALRQHDIKLLLAFGTVSQLGLLMVLAGLGHPEATIAACALLLAHAAFKAALFMVVGIVDHATHTRDLRVLGGFGRAWRPTLIVATVSAASMAGVAPLAGFIAKESALEALLHGAWFDTAALVGVTLGSVLTVAYSIRFVWGTFVGTSAGPDDSVRTAHAPGTAFLAPAAVLAVVTTALGVWPGLFTSFVRRASTELDVDAVAKLSLWHGLNVALGLSIVALVGGGLVFAGRGRVDAVQQRLRPPGSAAGGYELSVRFLLRAADQVTGAAQPGSLPLYIAVVLLTACGVPGMALLLWGSWPGWPDLVGSPAELAVAALVIGGAVAATVATRRFTAALLLGAVGYGMALLFVVQGAPDLALTQITVETLTVVLFLLVLRFLPDRFDRRPLRFSRVLRLAVSGAVGVFVFAVLLISSAARRNPPISGPMAELADLEAGGRNVVNVILVDLRGLDTLGEITVLVVAALGAVALARAGRRPDDGSLPTDADGRAT